MAWLVLVVAGLFETAWAIGLKYSEGFTRVVPSVLTLIALIVSMVLLGVAVRDLPIGTAYAVWVGIGAFGVALLGVLIFDEVMTFPRAAFLLMLLIAIVGLRLTNGEKS